MSMGKLTQVLGAVVDVEFSDGALPSKTKELIAVACSVLADCIPCIDWHYMHAVKAGASQEELSEALAISMAVISGSKRAKYGPVVTKLEEHCKK